MKDYTKYFVLCTIYFVLSFSFSSGQTVSSDLTETFAFNVKSIDDFIDRFNFVSNTEFTKYFKDNYPEQDLTREKLILSLFNFKNKSFSGNMDVKNFVSDVSDSLNPEFVNFADSLWFAEVECKIIYAKKPRNLTLILKVEKSINNSFKWSIVSAHAIFLGKDTLVNDSLSFILNNDYMKNRISDQSRYFLHPVSHALDFMNIDNLFNSEKKVFEEFIYPGPLTRQLSNLINKVKRSEIKFVQVNTISYHFLQIDGWIAIVDYFNRNEKNSGWLINSLIRATDNQKKIYLKKHLNVYQIVD